LAYILTYSCPILFLFYYLIEINIIIFYYKVIIRYKFFIVIKSTNIIFIIKFFVK
jgi:hypothetical protein